MPTIKAIGVLGQIAAKVFGFQMMMGSQKPFLRIRNINRKFADPVAGLLAVESYFRGFLKHQHPTLTTLQVLCEPMGKTDDTDNIEVFHGYAVACFNPEINEDRARKLLPAFFIKEIRAREGMALFAKAFETQQADRWCIYRQAKKVSYFEIMPGARLYFFFGLNAAFNLAPEVKLKSPTHFEPVSSQLSFAMMDQGLRQTMSDLHEQGYLFNMCLNPVAKAYRDGDQIAFKAVVIALQLFTNTSLPHQEITARADRFLNDQMLPLIEDTPS